MALESQLVLESDRRNTLMEQFKPTVALNRGIDRSDEMAQGVVLPLFLHPFFPILPPCFLNHSTDFFSTAEFHLYVNEEKEPS